MRIVAFDSGVGGLSVLAPLFKKIPQLDVHYLGDIANLPYGTKSPERVRGLTQKNLTWLLSAMSPAPRLGDVLLVACNTASAEALDLCEENFSKTLPVVGVIEASCDEAIAQKTSSITVLATNGTVKSGAYEKLLRKKGYTGRIQQIPCPLFVPFVEEAILEGPAIEWVVDRYLGPKVQTGEAVILGCTHYPYLLPLLQKKYPAHPFIQAGEALKKNAQLFPGNGNVDLTKSKLRITVTDSNASRDQIQFFLKQLGISELPWTLDVIQSPG